MFVCYLKLKQKTPIIQLIQSGMVWEGTHGQNMRTNMLSPDNEYCAMNTMNTVLFVNANIGFPENLFLVLGCVGHGLV